MNKNEFIYEVFNMAKSKGIVSEKRVSNIKNISLKICNKYERKKGANEKREEMFTKITQILNLPDKHIMSEYEKDVLLRTKVNRFRKWKIESSEALALEAGYTDEHGSSYNSGDYLSIRGIDFIGKHQSNKPPYFDMGKEGLGLIKVTRKRVYARSSKWMPSYAETKFLVGKNESGTYFSHAVSPNCKTVLEAISWIWNGLQDKIIRRQGDIALIEGNGPKGLNKLPTGHKVDGECIIHNTHPSIPVPAKGQRIIVGRRAAERASKETRD